MSKRYLLPCTECAQKIAIETILAGQMVKCSGCGTRIKVGTLRDIRALDSADPAPVSSHRSVAKAKMSSTGRIIFVLGVLFLAIGTIWGSISFAAARGKQQVEFDPNLTEVQERNLRRNLKGRSPTSFRKLYEETSNPDMVAEWTEHAWRRLQREAAEHRISAIIGFSVGAIGLTGIVLSLIGNKQPKR